MTIEREYSEIEHKFIELEKKLKKEIDDFKVKKHKEYEDKVDEYFKDVIKKASKNEDLDVIKKVMRKRDEYLELW